jgi:uncharacterized protein YraI
MMKTTFRYVMVMVLSIVVVGGLWLSAPLHSEARGAAWTVYVYGNPDLAGAPLYTGASPAINYHWGTKPPVINGVDTHAYGVPKDRFSVRFTGSMFFTAGTYRFTVEVDDGARLYIDGGLLINQWVGGSLRSFQADYSFSADGTHAITVEMFDNIDQADITASWALIGPPSGGGGGATGTGTAWYGEFFNNTDWLGTPVFTASYPASGLDLNWGQASPGGTIPVDNFTARFTRTMNVPGDLPVGMYLFYAKADDNFRFWIDTTLIMDHAGEFANNQTYTAEVALLNGPHILKFEYRELTADASLFLTWSPPNAQNPVLAPPEGAVQPGATASPAAGAPPPPPVGIRGMVMGNLRIREQPTTRSQKIGLMPWGTEVDLLGKDRGLSWYMVSYNGIVGWSYAPWIKIIQGAFNQLPYTDGTQPEFEPPPATEGVVVQAYGNMRVRSGPGFQYPKIARAVWGSRVQLLARSTNGLWYKIKYGDVIGWSYAVWYRPVQGDPTSVPVADQ